MLGHQGWNGLRFWLVLLNQCKVIWSGWDLLLLIRKDSLSWTSLDFSVVWYSSDL